MGTLLYAIFGLWLLFIGTKLISALIGGLVGVVRSLRRQKGTNP